MIKYRNKQEERAHKLLPNTLYEPFKIDYPVDKMCTYLPDFVDEDRHIIWEYKGYFRMRADASKYIPIVAECNKQGWRFIFIFQNPKTSMPGVRLRSNGTRQTVAEWATKNNFEWVTIRSIPKELRCKLKKS